MQNFETQLVMEITKLPKIVIIEAMKTLDIHTDKNHTKQRMSSDFVKGIYQMIKHNVTLTISLETTLNKIYSNIKQQDVVRILKTTFEKQNGQFSQSSHSIRRNFNLIQNQREKLRCICDNVLSGKVIQCIDCQSQFHIDCLKILRTQKFQCPLCFAKNMDPLNQVKQIMFCGWLNFNDRIHRIPFVYNLFNNQQNLKVQIRCFRLDGINNYSITYPDYGDVKLNQYQLLELKPLANNSSLKKRKDQITIINKQQLRTNNILLISQRHLYLKKDVRVGHYNHFICICLTKELTTKQLIQKVITQSNSIERFDKQTFMQQCLELQSVNIQLKCPLSFMKIQIPVRGRQCMHFSSFDLETFIIMTTKNRQWKCPICNRKSHQLVVNQVLFEILKNNTHLNLSGVTFYKDNTFTLIQQDQDSDQDENSNIKVANSDYKVKQLNYSTLKQVPIESNYQQDSIIQNKKQICIFNPVNTPYFNIPKQNQTPTKQSTNSSNQQISQHQQLKQKQQSLRNVPIQNSFSTKQSITSSHQPSTVSCQIIQIIDSGDQTSQQKITRYIQTEKFLLKSMLIQKNIKQTPPSSNKMLIAQKIFEKVINLCN